MRHARKQLYLFTLSKMPASRRSVRLYLQKVKCQGLGDNASKQKEKLLVSVQFLRLGDRKNEVLDFLYEIDKSTGQCITSDFQPVVKKQRAVKVENGTRVGIFI